MRAPSRRISPPAIRPGGSSRPMIAAPVSDLPAPDSPTTPRSGAGILRCRLARARRRAAADGLLVVDADREIRGEPVRPDRDQVIARARLDLERELALGADPAGAAGRPLHGDLAHPG